MAVTIAAYEELVEKVGADSTLTIFAEQIEAVKIVPKEKRRLASKGK